MLAAAACNGASASDLKEKAKRNLHLGVFTHVYSKFSVEDAARQIKAGGFGAAVMEGQFADVKFDAMKPDWNIAEQITSAFDRAGVKIAAVAGYYNVVDPDLERRKRGEERMRTLIVNWKRLGSPIICTETGTKNAQSEWTESPENTTEKAYEECRGILFGLAKEAESAGAIVAIEPYWRNVIDSTERTARLFREVKSPALKLVMDPCNYYKESDLPRMRPMLEEIFHSGGKQTVIAHAKDVVSAPNGPDLPAAGKGVLDYPLFLELLAKLNQPQWLIIEHLSLDDVPRARDYVLGQFDKIR
jgi:sugar phosphate isomerase/epimerase